MNVDSDPKESGPNDFELEPEDKRALPVPSAPKFDPEVEREERDERDEPDTRTVAERRGKALEVTQGALPAPPNWPREAFQFPLRQPGPGLLAGMSGAFVIADLVALAPPIQLLSLLGVLLLWVFSFRVQAAIAGQTAAGHDEPRGFDQALELDYDTIRTFARFWILFALVVAFLYVGLKYEFLSSSLAVAIVIGSSLMLSVALLGCALGDRALARPWNALPWLARRPLAFVAGAVGWWAMALAQVVIGAASHSVVLYILASVVLRPLGLYAMVVSARALGVAGRSWTPWGYQSPDTEDASTDEDN